jgi:sterol desaturase/sphingolipid hydroxylase (fatty acid hydroxylase superfamily)
MLYFFIIFNSIPFISIFLNKLILPSSIIIYKKEKFALAFFYYLINTNIICSFFSHSGYIQNANNFRMIPIIYYTIMFEGIFYIWHRFSHLPSFYKYLHAHHHVNYHVCPLDFIDVNYTDSLGFHICMHLPLTIVSLQSLEYLTWYFIIITSGFLLHSNILGEHHVLHHKYFHSNYCFLFPIFDIIFQTNQIHSS